MQLGVNLAGQSVTLQHPSRRRSFLYVGLDSGGNALGDGYFMVLLHVYEAFVLGTLDTGAFDDLRQSIAGHIFFVLLTGVTLIIQLNLLIALMTDQGLF